MKMKLTLVAAMTLACAAVRLAAMPTEEEARRAEPVVKKMLAQERAVPGLPQAKGDPRSGERKELGGDEGVVWYSAGVRREIAANRTQLRNTRQT